MENGLGRATTGCPRPFPPFIRPLPFRRHPPCPLVSRPQGALLLSGQRSAEVGAIRPIWSLCIPSRWPEARDGAMLELPAREPLPSLGVGELAADAAIEGGVVRLPLLG